MNDERRVTNGIREQRYGANVIHHSPLKIHHFVSYQIALVEQPARAIFLLLSFFVG